MSCDGAISAVIAVQLPLPQFSEIGFTVQCNRPVRKYGLCSLRCYNVDLIATPRYTSDKVIVLYKHRNRQLVNQGVAPILYSVCEKLIFNKASPLSHVAETQKTHRSPSILFM